MKLNTGPPQENLGPRFRMSIDAADKESCYYIDLKNAGVPVEMHLYAEGGHAFGLRKTEFEISEWPELLLKWLKSIKII